METIMTGCCITWSMSRRLHQQNLTDDDAISAAH